MLEDILTVTELRDFINQTLTYAYPLVVVEGEVSGFNINQGKWVFFDIKDSKTTVGCFMSVHQLKTVLEDGMVVRIEATPKLTERGRFSLTVKKIELGGEGEARRAFELMKARFEQEGLFDPARKRDLPQYPQKIGLITSRDAAAFNDFVTIAQDRWPAVEVHHIHVHVQGMQAPDDIVRALKYINQEHGYLEALVLIRGGGSMEDLQAFNHEEVVRTVYASQIPVIVGIGHEDDVCLAESAADMRASTPTDAARRLLPDRQEVARHLDRLSERNANALRALFDKASRVLALFTMQQARHIGRLADRIDRVNDRMNEYIKHCLDRLSYRVKLAERTLIGVNPEKVLARGYAIVRQNNKVIHDSSQIRASLPVLVQLHRGIVKMTVSNKETTDEKSQTSLEFS